MGVCLVLDEEPSCAARPRYRVKHQSVGVVVFSARKLCQLGILTEER